MRDLAKAVKASTSPTWITERALRRRLVSAIGRSVSASGGTWLDIGCGKRPYESLFGGHAYVGIDVPVSGRRPDLKLADVYYDGLNLPLRSGSVDGVLC